MNIIVDPSNNVKYSIFSQKGKALLKHFIKLYQKGGSNDSDDDDDPDDEEYINMEQLLELQKSILEKINWLNDKSDGKAITSKNEHFIKLFKLFADTNATETQTELQGYEDFFNKEIPKRTEILFEIKKEDFEIEKADLIKNIEDAFKVAMKSNDVNTEEDPNIITLKSYLPSIHDASYENQTIYNELKPQIKIIINKLKNITNEEEF